MKSATILPFPKPRHKANGWRGRGREEPVPARLYFGRPARWYAREALTLFVLVAFVAVIAHIAGQVGALTESRP